MPPGFFRFAYSSAHGGGGSESMNAKVNVWIVDDDATIEPEVFVWNRKHTVPGGRSMTLGWHPYINDRVAPRSTATIIEVETFTVSASNFATIYLHHDRAASGRAV